MRFLHTSDWHIGKTLKGQSRLAEQRGVLEEIVGIVRENDLDAILVAGDIYDSAAPSAEAQQLLVRTLLEIRGLGVPVVAIAGNHDHAATFDAYRPLMKEVGIHLVGSPGVDSTVAFTARSTGEPVVIATLPFVSQRSVIRAAELVANTPVVNSIGYAQRVEEMLVALSRSFRPDAINIVLAHLTVTGGKRGGGEREAQSIFEYEVRAAAFPTDAQYVALGHLHRRQSIDAPGEVHYSGSPIAIDFGEQDNDNVICLVESSPGGPTEVTDIPIKSGRRLMTVRGTLDEIVSQAAAAGGAFLRVQLKEQARAGLLEAVHARVPNALEVRIDQAFAAPAAGSRPTATSGLERTPAELFAEYCATKNINDPRLDALFASLHDAVSGS
jgi:exonuclease SbcD